MIARAVIGIAMFVALASGARAQAPLVAPLTGPVVAPSAAQPFDPALAAPASNLVAPLQAPAQQQQQQQQAAVPPVAPLVAPVASSAASSDQPLMLDSHPIPLGGALRAPGLWQAWKMRFVTEHGRVIDTGNGMISHSEGQGYGMLLAVAAGDRPVFDRIWSWTRANLHVRDDNLFAWRWEPNQRPAVADMNDASDGDILIAWALTEAAEFWGDISYRVEARRIAVEVGRKVVVYKTKPGPLLLPGVAGFSAAERQDGPVVNLSYWIFPAFARLPLVAPEIDWAGISQSGMDLLKMARFGSSALPTDWISAHAGKVSPAEGFAPQFGYNAIRIPLYLAWAGIGERPDYQPFINWARSSGSMLPIVEVSTGQSVQSYGEPGYASVAALLACVSDHTPFPPDMRMMPQGENYYPATLQMLAILAAQMRYPSCVSG